MSKKLLIHQYLSKTGKFKSKEEIIDALHAGEIKINGEIITNKQFQINPNNTTVSYHGEILSDIQPLYVVLHKPVGFSCARVNNSKDGAPQKSIFDLLNMLNLSPRIAQTLFTVGRVEDETSGLLILTNDTLFRDAILKSKDPIPHIYRVRLLKPITDAQHRLLKSTITVECIDHGKRVSIPTQLQKIEIDVEDRCNISITMDEEKKNQIKNLIAAIGNEVIDITHTHFGGLSLQSLRLPKGMCDKVDVRILEEILDKDSERKILTKF